MQHFIFMTQESSSIWDLKINSYVLVINTIERCLFVTFERFTLIIAIASYQYCSYLYYREIHLRRFIFWYCTFIYNNAVIFISKNKITEFCLYHKFWNFSFVIFLNTIFCCRQRNKQPSNFRLSTTQCNQWKTEHYRGLDYQGEVDLDSDINCLSLTNLLQ